MKENVLIAPGVDKPAALIRESLDGSLLTVQFLKSVLQRCSKHSVLSDLLETRHPIRWIGDHVRLFPKILGLRLKVLDPLKSWKYQLCFWKVGCGYSRRVLETPGHGW